MSMDIDIHHIPKSCAKYAKFYTEAIKEVEESNNHEVYRYTAIYHGYIDGYKMAMSIGYAELLQENHSMQELLYESGLHLKQCNKEMGLAITRQLKTAEIICDLQKEAAVLEDENTALKKELENKS